MQSLRATVYPLCGTGGVRIFRDLTAAAAVWGRVAGTISQPIPGGAFPAYKVRAFHCPPRPGAHRGQHWPALRRGGVWSAI